MMYKYLPQKMLVVCIRDKKQSLFNITYQQNKVYSSKKLKLTTEMLQLSSYSSLFLNSL